MTTITAFACGRCAATLDRLSAEAMAEAERYADQGNAANYQYFKTESERLRDRSLWMERFAKRLGE